MSVEDTLKLEKRKKYYAKEIREVCETDGVDSGIKYVANLLAYFSHLIDLEISEKDKFLKDMKKRSWWKRTFGYVAKTSCLWLRISARRRA